MLESTFLLVLDTLNIGANTIGFRYLALMQMYHAFKVTWLASSASEHDGPPTQGMLEVAKTIDNQIKDLASQIDEVFAKDLAKLNRQAKKLGVPFVQTTSK